MKRLRVFLAITAISVLGFNTSAHAVPSFARQTGLACAACHTNYPELTQFGRVFKLNGYTLTGIKQIQAEPTTGAVGLKINEIPPLSAMLQISATAMKKQDPASQNGSVGFPQAASLFFAGEIAEHLGTFMQVTYTQDAGKFNWDNTDVRYANQAGGTVWGVTLNNNPTVQDVWNTTPAWGFPYSASSVAPGAITSTKIDSGAGGFGQSVGGLGVYMWLDDHFYAEITDYTSAIRGGAHPIDSTQSNVVSGSAPYWRLAYEQRWDRNSLSVGAFGLNASLHPGN